MRLAIMQPYFLPYIGYFQLIAAADVFIIYDSIKYTKKGWINRNRMLLNGAESTFSLPLKRDSDSLDIVEREIAAEYDPDKFCQQIRGAYQRAPYFLTTFPIVEQALHCESRNLFEFIRHTLEVTCAFLDIHTEVRVSSTIPIADGLKGQDKVLALCKQVGAESYINSIGGMTLYSREAFLHQGIDLRFLQPRPLVYPQFSNDFVPWLSILDVMMFNPVATIRAQLREGFDLIPGG
jgi:hypothetical protein